MKSNVEAERRKVFLKWKGDDEVSWYAFHDICNETMMMM